MMEEEIAVDHGTASEQAGAQDVVRLVDKHRNMGHTGEGETCQEEQPDRLLHPRRQDSVESATMASTVERAPGRHVRGYAFAADRVNGASVCSKLLSGDCWCVRNVGILKRRFQALGAPALKQKILFRNPSSNHRFTHCQQHSL